MLTGHAGIHDGKVTRGTPPYDQTMAHHEWQRATLIGAVDDREFSHWMGPLSLQAEGRVPRRFHRRASRGQLVPARERHCPKKERRGQKKGKIRIGSSSTTSSRLKTFSVTEPGDYILNVKPGTNQELTVSKITLDVRQNVKAVDPPVVIVGVVLIVGSIIVLVVLSKKSRTA